MNLTDREKEIIKAHIDRGEALPAKYKLMLFEDAPEVELVWQGKTGEVTSAVLPHKFIHTCCILHRGQVLGIVNHEGPPRATKKTGFGWSHGFCGRHG